MNLKYSQIQIVVASSKYCVKSRNESCVPFLSHCNTFIQSLQLRVFAGMEDLGHEVLREVLITEKMVSLPEKNHDQLWPHLWSSQALPKHSVIAGVHWRATCHPQTQPGTRCKRESRRPLPIGPSLLPFSSELLP